MSNQKVWQLTTVLALVLLFCSNSHLASSTIPSTENTCDVVLTDEENGLKNKDEFSCTGTIHAYITCPEPIVGERLLRGIWALPNGAVNQDAKIPINFPSPGRRTAYLWLEFEDQSKGGLLSFREPAEEDVKKANQVYDGEWNLTVELDSKQIFKDVFQVKCT